MAQVPGAPYEPYPTVAPAERVLRPGGIPQVPDAYGAGVARAVGAFGGDVEKVGSELFNTALDLRKQQIETAVRDAGTDHYNNVEAQHEKFMTAEGGDAGPAQLQTYLASLDAAHKAARNDVLSKYGPYGAVEFDNQTSNMERSFIREASAHSFQQVRAAQKTSLDAQYGTLGERVAAAPDDEEVFTHAANTARASTSQVHPGLDQTTTDTLGAARVSKLTVERAVGKAEQQNDIPGALAIIDQAEKASADVPMNQKTILPTDAAAARKTIQQAGERNNAFAKQNEALAREKAQDDVAGIVAKSTSYDDQGRIVVNPNVYKQLNDYKTQNPIAQQYVEERKANIDAQLRNADRGVVVQTNKDVLSGLTKNMFDPNRPTNERDVALAETDGMINPATDGKWLRGIIDMRDRGDKAALADPFFKVAAENARIMIEGSTAIDRQMNAGTYASFQYRFLSEYLQKVHDHDLKSNDLNMGDEKSWIRQLVEQYRPGIGQTIQNNGGVGSPPPGAPAPITAPPAAPTVPAATPVAAPRPVTAGVSGGVSAQPMTLPPIDQRVDGRTYPTARGYMQWSKKDNGWVVPRQEGM